MCLNKMIFKDLPSKIYDGVKPARNPAGQQYCILRKDIFGNVMKELRIKEDLLTSLVSCYMLNFINIYREKKINVSNND